MRKMRGITLISLVVTILVILILSGVAVATLTGNNGIINKSIIAKKQAIIADEKELLHLSTTSAISKDKNLKIEKDKLEFSLNYNIGNKDKTFEIIEYDNNVNIRFFVVKFLDSKNVYLVEDKKEAEWIGNLNDSEEVVVPKNLVYGLEDTTEDVISSGIKYSINNKIITVTARRNDGYGYTSGRVYLELGQDYIFECVTNGTWGWINGEDTVEMFLALNGSYSAVNCLHMFKNPLMFPRSPFPIIIYSGTYFLRIDVNQEAKTYNFSDISVKLRIK